MMAVKFNIHPCRNNECSRMAGRDKFCYQCQPYEDKIADLKAKLSATEEKLYLAHKGSELNPSGGWIKCSERLPENDDSVLVYDRIEESCVVAYYVDGEWGPDTDCLTASNYDGGAHISLDVYNVTHWQPLPPKPSEEV